MYNTTSIYDSLSQDEQNLATATEFKNHESDIALLTPANASLYFSNLYHKTITPANINYLINYGKISKIVRDNQVCVDRDELEKYYKEQQENKFILPNTEIYCGDCLGVLQDMKDNSIDLIITSPPYADQRKNNYESIHPDQYVEWFLPRAEQFKRVLKNTGSFVLNIKEKAVNGERHIYVLELILALRKQGWLWTEEYIWYKKNSYPGKWPNRFRDSWERLLHFTKQKKFNMYQDEVKVPMGDWKDRRLNNLSEKDKMRDNAKNGSGFGKNISNWLNKDMVYPSNVLNLATECANKNHSAVFPESLPTWFIKLFTKENDVVLDPFAGSGTTLLSANKLGRKSIGIDNKKEYIDLIIERIKNVSR